ncbi:chromosome segregation protein SMC [Clostridiaceae bacterium UIB06]|uniref:Chromosome partition protein Smc n=1 Tax=Clostridium thailandense TaxID=2794346 RepID=A0A949TGU2_9CLOT|nr:chromosome segregation protein SMC [Clostridium thailandense]MBV7271965.1 chromosome segregation protein SMC [Clostridium thailandense]MCH5137191.1 chromosome segregation protein SMC [Clostridiaceae bacterium UIB06]
MYLKSIEIRGFKSFADKTELLFKNGVTSIVGPNGSGKSNISDAVKWVLGEQSVKSLRGGKMEDVIFAGTQFRKPVGLSQVSLTLDNEDKKLPLDYTDITVSRRLYRSGESEYFINNTQCRLKDIHELFMDTGIGKEGYSIIGQGKIEAVLSGRPEERRSLLEEAAGIVKFKWRKEEAEKKLENTDTNLIRINDILGAYEERLEPLSIENEKAKKFIKLSEELKQKEINMAVYSIDKIESKINSLENSIIEMNGNTEELNKKLMEFKDNINIYNEKLENLNAENSDCKKQYYDSKEKKQNVGSEINLLSERLENLYNDIKKNSTEIGQIETKLENIISDRDLQNNELSSLKKEQEQINKQIYEHENNVEAISASILDKTNLIKKLKDDQIEYLSSISNLKNNILNLKNDTEALKEKIEDIKNSCESYLHSIKINVKTKEAFLGQIENIKAKIINLQSNMKSNLAQISKLNSTLTIKEKEFRDLNNNHNKLEANHNMLVNLDKQYEGYNRSVKTLMNDVNKGKVALRKNSCFVLGEVIKVEKKFEIAIEIALGGAISDVITKDELIAKDLIKYLKLNNIGRATFLPLTIVRGRKAVITKAINEIEGYVGIASELINYDNSFINAVEHILGRTIICDTMDSALKIAKVSNYSFKIVTLSGEVVNPGGSLTGGSLHNRSANIIGRKREIEDIKLKIKDTEENINKLNLELQKCRSDIKTLDEENLNLKDQVYIENIEITKLKEKLNAIDDESGKLKGNLEVSNKEVEILNEKLKENIEEFQTKDKELEMVTHNQTKNDNLINEIEEKLEDKNEEIDNAKEKLTYLKIKKAQIDEGVLNKNLIFQKLLSDIAELNQKKKIIEEENKKSRENIDKHSIQIKNNKKEVGRIEKLIDDLDNKIKEQDIEIIKIKGKIKIDSGSLENLSLIIDKKEEELHKIQLSQAKLISEKEAMYSKLNDEFEITYAEALDYKEDIENLEDIKKEISILKSNISSLGTVNLSAIDEYKEVTEKVNFMTEQKEDLIKSKDELIKVIDEMTNKMKFVFNENFNKLRKNFNETFKELFKGGSADLILTNGDELNGNIDITVQPPGKKLQNINLMSGGEKGLSAIALLFAILKMKPTPFCILDEIEAALDDANVNRYAEFLKKFSENIQFIVITHRKGTMEASDALYGVTMEEKGISKIVSVDLSREEAS